ncbi:hypothetical protein RCC89_02255 [Cytophagaceae bacterium ABcell3]|nr:hypothetical protein RCC89_02255 [Cytophagaceae bacterium ABcell3]
MKPSIIFIALLLINTSCISFLSEEEIKELEEKQEKAENSVKQWIQKYALYPKSYEEIAFDHFQEGYTSRKGKKVPDSETYVIWHKHKLLTRDSIPSTFSGYFLMENDFYITLIEEKRSNAIAGGFPPKVNDWMEKLGRELNYNDTLELNQRQQIVTEKSRMEIKRIIENIDTYEIINNNENKPEKGSESEAKERLKEVIQD